MTDVTTDERDVKTPDVGVVELDELDRQLVGLWWIRPAHRGCG